uniref:Uncharacterized protein n=1 Tax=Anguilla anguilla TaxID=7936 RepID=A0A0E9TQ06_ANGAN
MLAYWVRYINMFPAPPDHRSLCVASFPFCCFFW